MGEQAPSLRLWSLGWWEPGSKAGDGLQEDWGDMQFQGLRG